MNKRLPFYLCGSLLAMSLFFVASCNRLGDLEDLETTNYDAEFAIPLFHATTSFEDLLSDLDQDSYVQVQDDNLLSLYYSGDLIARTSEDLFAFLEDYNGIPFPVTDTLMALPFNIPNSLDLDYGILKSGTIKWGYQKEYEEPVEVKVTIPNATLNGVPFTKTTMHGAGELPFFLSNEYDLTGYTLAPIDGNLFVRYESYRLVSEYADTLTNFAVVFDDFAASYIEGYLGEDVYELYPDTIEIDFFDNWTRGDVYFADPRILLTVRNSFGFPVRAKANVMNVITVEDEVLELNSPFIDSINIAYPALNEAGEVKETFFSFTTENSNIDTILGSNPARVAYDMDALPNPDMDTSIRGFMTDTSSFRVQVEVELPINGSAYGFEARDTFDVNFLTYDEVKAVEFKMISENELPLDMSAQVYFATEDGIILDSLFVENTMLLDGAPVDMDGNVISISEKISLIQMDKEQFDRVRLATKLYLSAAMSSTDAVPSTGIGGNPNVRVLSTQKVSIRMGMKIEIEK